MADETYDFSLLSLTPDLPVAENQKEITEDPRNESSPLPVEKEGDDDPFYHIENWYPPISDLTYATTFLPLSEVEVQALIASSTSLSFATFWGEAPQNTPSPTGESETPELSGLLRRIDDAIGCHGAACVKLSTRSPKDAVTERAEKMIEQELVEEARSSTPHTVEGDILMFFRYASLALRVTSARDALNLFRASERVYLDLRRAVYWKREVSAVVRAWDDSADPTWELRCFVAGGGLVAVTQYYKWVHVPGLWAQREAVEQRVKEYFETVIAPRMRPLCERYTVDLAVSPVDLALRVVEINDPPPVAGTALFDWNSAADRSVLLSGPLEFRFVPPTTSGVVDVWSLPEDIALDGETLAIAKTVARIRRKVRAAAR